MRLLAPRVLAIAAGGLIIFTNVRTLLGLDAVQSRPPGAGAYYAILGALAALWIAGMVWVVRRELADRTARRSPDRPEKVLVNQ